MRLQYDVRNIQNVNYIHKFDSCENQQTSIRAASGDNGLPSSHTTKSDTSSTTPAHPAWQKSKNQRALKITIDISTTKIMLQSQSAKQKSNDKYLCSTALASLVSAGMAPSHVWTDQEDLLVAPPDRLNQT